MFENITKVDKRMTEDDVANIVNCLLGHFFFSNLNQEELEKTIEKMFYCSVKRDNYVFKEGDKNASCFFIIDRGLVAVEIGGARKKEMSKKQSFGELALLYNAPRSASILCLEDTYFWAIDRKMFRVVMEDVSAKQFEQNKLFASGPTEDGYGALIIYEAETPEAVEALMKGDPFFAAGVFLTWTVRPWKMVFFNANLAPKA